MSSEKENLQINDVRAHHMFSRILQLRIYIQENEFIVCFDLFCSKLIFDKDKPTRLCIVFKGIFGRNSSVSLEAVAFFVSCVWL